MQLAMQMGVHRLRALIVLRQLRQGDELHRDVHRVCALRTLIVSKTIPNEDSYKRRQLQMSACTLNTNVKYTIAFISASMQQITYKQHIHILHITQLLFIVVLLILEILICVCVWLALISTS